ncbi:histidine Kinase [Stigmatella aurantiaca DW4/3-1]|uniref:histidine kinase n=1 Tax=Stigmatella aurantiaca (strain DW4/3-1) TaxID=378806 RepID=Q097D0_STIAD|nr:histidine Kinase [Stigmatella aurantiaca DW4/3-1]
MEHLKQLLTARAQELTGASGAVLATLEQGELVGRVATGSLARTVGEKLGLDLNPGGAASKARLVWRVDDTEADARVEREACRKLGARALVVASLACGERLIAVLVVVSPRAGAFGENEERGLALVARGGGSLLAHAEAAKAAIEREAELKTLRALLRRREAELDGVLQSVEGSAYVLSEDSPLRANRAAQELLGAGGAPGLTGRASLLERLQPRAPETQEQVAPEEEPLARALAGTATTRELLVRHAKAGGDVLARIAAVPVRVDGTVVGAVVVQSDVGAERKEQFLTLVERSSECIGITSLSGQPMYLNPAGQEMLGFETPEAFRSASVMDTYLAEDRDLARTAFRAVRERGSWEGELRLRHRRTGEAIPVRHHLFTLAHRETGRPVALGAVTRDLREQKRAEAVRERLMDIVGNELRAPLSAITMAASTLLRRGTLAEVDTKAAARISQGAERMGRTLGQVLDFTRTYLGAGLVLLRSRVDLDMVTQDVVAAVELEHPDRLVRYVKRGDARGIWDRERLVELLSTLLGYSLRTGPVDRPVDVRLLAEGMEVVLEVRREGEAIPAEVLSEMFNPFFYPPQAQLVGDEVTREHLGLGLFITREITRAHGGHMEVTSSQQEGTLFQVYLPRGPVGVR